MANPWDKDQVVVPAQRGATVIPQNPYAGNAEQRAQEDQAIELEKLRLAQQAAELAAQNANKPPAGYRATADGGLEPIPGGPADKSEVGKVSEAGQKARTDALTAYNSADSLDRLVAEIEAAFNQGPGSTSPLLGFLDYLPTPANRQFDAAGNSVRGLVGNALGFTGGQLNSLAEAQMAVGPYVPQAGDSDAVIKDKIRRIRDLANDARRRSVAILGGTPDASGRITPLEQAPPARAPVAAGAGATTQAFNIPPEMQAEHAAYMQRTAGNLNPQEYAQFRAALDQKYGVTPADPAASAAYAEALNERGITSGFAPLSPGEVPLEGLDKLRNDIVSNPLGAFGAGFTNAVGLGLPSLLAQDQTAALREANPVSSLAGEIVGGIGGTLLTGGALGQVAGRVSNPTVAGLLANPLTSDVLYGTTYGATQDGAAGAAAGAAGAVGGNLLGRAVGRFAPRVTGTRPATDPLGGGERAVYNAASGDGIDDVTAALTRGQELGLPMNMADASPSVNTLAGAALRRSPQAAGSAREALFDRGRGQYDRFTGAIERDLGPLDNVVGRSDDLIQQARTAASPLYSEAYAAPVVSTPEISSLLATPFGRQGLGRAQKIAANERRNPEGMGFSLDEAGEIVLNPIPHDALGALGAAEREVFDAENALKAAQASLVGPKGPAQARYDAAVEALNTARSGIMDAPTVGTAATQPGYTTQTLDYVKRGMDDVLEQYRNPFTGKLELDEAGRAENAVLRSLLGEVDRVNPAFGQARAAYAGPASEREALRQGADAMGASPDVLAVQVGSKTPGQLEQMQLGYRDALAKRGGAVRDASNPYEATLGSEQARQRLQVMYPGRDEDIARLLSQRDLEGKMAASSNRLIGNSMTAERQLADQAFGQSSLGGDIAQGLAETAITGAPVATVMKSGLFSGARNAISDWRTLGVGKRAQALADEVAPIALNTNTQEAVDALAAMQARDAEYQEIARLLLQQAQTRGGHGGAGAGSAVAAALMRE